MISVAIEKHDHVIHARISGVLDESDFDETIEPAVEEMMQDKDRPYHIMLDAEDFEGWNDFPAFVRHMEFIRDHHRAVDKVAVKGTGAGLWQKVLPHIAAMVPDTEIRFFAAGQDSQADTWLSHR